MKMSVRCLVQTLAVTSVVLLAGCVAPEDCPSNKRAQIELQEDPLLQSAARISEPVRSVPLTPSLAEVVRLSQSGLTESVLLAYVDDAPGPFSANAEQVVAIRDAGVPQPVIAAMLRHPSNQAARAQQAAVMTSPALTDTNTTSTNAVATNAVIIAESVRNVARPVVLQQPSVVSTPAQPVQYTDVLDPYGSWVDVPGHGLAWRPTVAVRDRSWRPYHTGGRWIYSNHGWYWLSDYSWGWVPFHYGRWVDNNRYGWVWVPGSDWGPAWVSWRYGRNYVGWAPLPPHAEYRPYRGFRHRGSRVSVRYEWGLGYNDYTFCPVDRFYSVNPLPFYFGRHRNQFIYSQTTVVNNFNQQGGATPSNSGVPVNNVQDATRTVVQKVRVVNTNPGTRIPVQPNRVVQSRDSLEIYRQPVAPIPARTTSSAGTPTRSATPVRSVSSPVTSNRSSSSSFTSSGKRGVTTRTTSPRSTTSRTTIRPREPVKSRTIFVDHVPVVRRPSSRPAPVSSSYTPAPSSTRSSRSSSSYSSPAPEPEPEPVASTSSKPDRRSRSSDNSSSRRSSSSRDNSRTPVTPSQPTPAATPAPSPVRAATPKPVVARPAPQPVAAPKPASVPSSRPTPAARPAPAPVSVTRSAPVVTRQAPAPTRSSAPSSSSNNDDDSGRPAGRPKRK